MRLSHLTLENFRNIALSDLVLDGRQQFFVGANGQGKTNLLEAVGYVTALRSFRTPEAELMISHGKDGAGLAYEFEHEVMDETGVTIKLRAEGKEVTCDGAWITKLGDFIGKFPTVVFSSQDQQLVRGVPGMRRRWLDLVLSAVDGIYLHALQSYHKALAARNRLLKRGAGMAELEAFEKPLASAAAQIVSKRRTNLAVLSGFMAEAYARLAGEGEAVTMHYQPDADEIGTAIWMEMFARARPRDMMQKVTGLGPHRDDFEMMIGGHAARDYGSEGQQRSLALALRLAQVEYFHQRTGVQPVLLADDVLGELDPERRRRFWAGIGPERQVLATGTELPAAELGTWQIFRVEGGTFREIDPSEAKR